MNKNPFAVASAYTPQQPPLPPGPPPPQPAQPDYSAYWAAAAAAQQAQQPAVAAYNPQWSAAQPAQAPPRPPPEQSALYANYGYGGQPNLSWQQQQQRQQQQYQPPPPVVQPPPQPPQPGYNPYQPQAGVYQQPYVPQVTPPQPAPQTAYQAQVPAPQPFQQSQQQFFPQQQQNRQHNRPPTAHHASPQHLPPAKRQRFDGPSNQHRGPPQPQFQTPPPPPPQQGQGAPLGGGVGVGMYNQNQGPSHGHGRGGGPGANQVPLGGNRGAFGGGRGGNMSGGRGRGGSMNMNRGGNRGRGGGMYNNVGGRGGGPTQGSSGSNFRGPGGSNRGFQNRENRRGSSFNTGGGQGFSHGHQQQHHHQQSFSGSSSFRNRNQGYGGSSRSRHESGTPHGPRDSGSSSNFSSGKKDENRRTLTDFKIIGLEIADLSWSWGVLPKEDDAPEVRPETSENQPLPAGPSDDKVVGQDASTEATTVSAFDAKESASKPDVPETAEPTAKAELVPPAMPPPPSRIRIYFHTPVTADDSHPMPPQNVYALGASSDPNMRKGKRKKLDDDDGDTEDGRGPPPPPPGLDHDSNAAPNDMDGSETAVGRGSVAPSVAPSVAETTSEADWLMAAIVEDEAETEADVGEHIQTAEADHPLDDDADAIGEDYVEGDVYDEIHDDSHMGAGLDHQTHVPPEGEHSENNPHYENGIVPVGPNDPKDSSHDHDSHSLADFDTSQVSVPHADETSASGEPISSIHGDSDSTTQSTAPNGDQVDRNNKTDIQNDAPKSPRTAPLQASDSLTSIATDANGEDATLSPYASTILNDESQPAVGLIGTQDFAPLFGDNTPKPEDEPTEDSANPVPPVIASDSGGGAPPHLPQKPATTEEKAPSANRLSISYAAGARRMVIDAEIVDSIRVFRAEGRIEVHMNICKLETRFKGILVEAFSDTTTTYTPLDLIHASPEDDTVPPFNQAQTPCKSILIAHLDREKPLSEPRWVKTGDVQEWLKSMFGRMFWVAGDAAGGWEKKIEVVDPDPPPTIWTVLEAWANNSSVGQQIERQRFLRTHMTETDNILEVLLRLVRGERASYSQSTPIISAPSVSGPLLSALSHGSAHGAQQTHVSLAVLAIFRLAVEFAKKAVGDGGKGEVEERVGEIIRCLPSHLIYKSLDGIFKEWRVEKKGGGR